MKWNVERRVITYCKENVFSNFNPAPISSIKYPKIPINVQIIISSLQENSLQYSTNLAVTYSIIHETYQENADISNPMTFENRPKYVY